MFADSRSYPAKVIAGMYKQEQELAKADEAGLCLTAVDLGCDNTTVISCTGCGEPTPHEVMSDRLLCPDCEWTNE